MIRIRIYTYILELLPWSHILADLLVVNVVVGRIKVAKVR